MAAALESLKTSAGKELVFRVAATSSAAKAVTLEVPAAVWAAISGSAVQSVTFAAGRGTVSLDRTSLIAVNTAANGEPVKLSITGTDLGSVMGNPAGGISEAARSTIGSRPVINLTVQTGSRTLSSFGEGKALVSIPYSLSSAEDANAVVAYNVTPAGKLVVLMAAAIMR